MMTTRWFLRTPALFAGRSPLGTVSSIGHVRSVSRQEFPREEPGFLAKQAQFRLYDGVAPTYDIVYLVPFSWSAIYSSMDAATVGIGVLMFAQALPNIHFIFLFELGLLVVFVLFARHKVSKACLRIYHDFAADNFVAVFPGFFARRRIVAFSKGELKLVDGVFRLSDRRFHCRRRFFKSNEHLIAMLE